MAQHADAGGDHHGDQQQKAQPDHQDQAHHPPAQQLIEIGFMARRLPDHIQRVLDLGEEAGRRHHQGDEADHAAGQGVGAAAHMQDGELHQIGGIRAHDPGELVMERAAGGGLAQPQRGDGRGDEQHRRNGRHGIKGDGRPARQRVVINEGLHAFLEQSPGGERVAGHGSPLVSRFRNSRGLDIRLQANFGIEGHSATY